MNPPDTDTHTDTHTTNLVSHAASHPMRERLARGLEDAVALLPLRAGRAPSVVLERISTSTIAAADHAALTQAVPNDVIAGVVQRFLGPLRGTALVATDPGDALLWLQLEESTAPPLEHFVAFGSRMLGAVVASLAEADPSEFATMPAALEERPLVAALLATHAPSDTLIVSLDAELAFELDPAIGTLHTPFTVQLLLDPKLLGSVLSGLR